MAQSNGNRVPLAVRVWHWLTALLFLILTITGIDLHFARPDSAPVIDYNWANWLHDWLGLALSGLYVLFLG